ncbi:class I SAM-dependent methyltransferase [Mariniflexile gromovii]|uniref:Class I SAM-dependent methyltransferase n=1 Tax=Mariniflexile gromovii TaxID=362523 RepID=A0ABS4BPH5_9FLAO|nr:class I SAM-dependent methyltransferase [Mariniflexile gromovii]MBP0902479.1 class I SAM-dependent methyltransferase [Mariniflexile gromovii]
MNKFSVDLSKKLYATTLLDKWSKIEIIYHHESFLIKKYLIDKTKNVLEAGTGGGRLVFYIEELGFKNISAFDFVPEMVDYANNRKRIVKSNIEFIVADATDLYQYENDSFHYLIYFQQVLGFISDESLFKNSLKEAYRIAQKNAIVMFSFSEWNSRKINPLISIVVNFLRIIRGEKYQKHHLPWLKLNGKFNWKFLNKNQPLVYWVKKDYLISLLENIGFSVIEVYGELNLVCKKI